MPSLIQKLPPGYIAIAFRKPRLEEKYLVAYLDTHGAEQSYILTHRQDTPNDIAQVIVEWQPLVGVQQTNPYVVGNDFTD